MPSTRVNTKKPRKPRAPVTGTLVGIRLQPDLLVAVDDLIALHDDPKPSRPEVIRLILMERLLHYKGFLDALKEAKARLEDASKLAREKPE